MSPKLRFIMFKNCVCFMLPVNFGRELRHAVLLWFEQTSKL